MSKDPKAFPGIEALRFLCSFAVLLWHYQHFFFASPAPVDYLPIWDPRKQPLFAALRPFYEHGHMAVEIFWAISGFIFFWKYASVLHARAISFRKFWILRFSRLYPLHFATLLFVAVGQAVYKHIAHAPFIYPKNNLLNFVLNLFFAQGWDGRVIYNFNGPTWSVSLELLAYAVFFGVATLFRYSLRNGLLYFAGSLLLWKFGFPEGRFAICMTQFFLGGVIYSVITLLAERPAAQRLVAQISGFIVFAGFAIAYRGPLNPNLGGGVTVNDVIDVIFTPALLLVVLLAFPTPETDSSRRLVEGLGDLTYATYLIHFPIQLTMVCITDSLKIPRETYFQPYLWATFIGTALILARFVFLYFEMPAQAWCRKWLAEKPSGR